MKYILVILFFCSCTFVFSQNMHKSVNAKSKTELDKLSKKLIGSWKCDGIEITNQHEYINQALEATPDSLKEHVNKHFDQVFKQMADTMNYCTLIFKEDETMESVFHHKYTKGRWHLSSDGLELTTKEDGSLKETKLSVLKFKKRKLLLYNDKEDIKVKIGFQKSK